MGLDEPLRWLQRHNRAVSRPQRLPMGLHLQRALGDGYFALRLTSTVGHTAEMCLDGSARFGFTVEDTALEPPESGSIKAAFADAGLGLGFADLRQAPRTATEPRQLGGVVRVERVSDCARRGSPWG
ncbi:erythromycin esterase family protein [Streptomyces sp. NPDC020096]